MTGSAPLLEVRDLRVAYGHVQAVRGVSLAVPDGGFVTLIGPNGAGKTSLLSALAGLVRPAAGTVRLAGRDVTGLPAHAAVAADGRSVLLIEHNVKLVMDVCDRITVLDFGKVIAEGAPAEVAKDPAVVAAYLGSGA